MESTFFYRMFGIFLFDCVPMWSSISSVETNAGFIDRLCVCVFVRVVVKNSSVDIYMLYDVYKYGSYRYACSTRSHLWRYWECLSSFYTLWKKLLLSISGLGHIGPDLCDSETASTACSYTNKKGLFVCIHFSVWFLLIDRYYTMFMHRVVVCFSSFLKRCEIQKECLDNLSMLLLLYCIVCIVSNHHGEEF